MSTRNKSFDIFGVSYRTKQFPAVPALEIMAGKYGPIDNLSLTEVYVREKGWVKLDSRESINTYVRDVTNIMPPRVVLEALLKIVNEFSFGFISGWKGVKIPKRFTTGDAPQESKYVDPLVSQLIQDEAATLRELEEYYSLEDAFKMFDVMVAKGVNSAVAHEAAVKQSKR